MKAYSLATFLIVFMHIYVASAAVTGKCAVGNTMCNGQCCDMNTFKNTNKTSITVECDVQRSTCTRSTDEQGKVTYSLQTENRKKMCDDETYCNKTNNKKYIYCNNADKTWDYCYEYDIQSVTDDHCDKGSFWHNNKCNSCAEITGEPSATTTKPNATMLSDCVIGTDTAEEYHDEKGTFTYLAACYVSCTDDTEYFCTSA